MPDGRESNVPPPRKSDLERESIELIEEGGPSLLVEQMLLVSGEVDRTNGFESGFPIHYAKRGGEWEPDPLVRDDQCVIANVRDQRLVIATGCGHAGIVNTIRHAPALTGIVELLRAEPKQRAEVIVNELLHLKVPYRGKLFRSRVRSHLAGR